MTKTVDGMCADCWGVKDATRAKRWLNLGPRQPLLDNPTGLLWLLGAVVAALLLALVLVSAWT
jgi:hypothetical protein